MHVCMYVCTYVCMYVCTYLSGASTGPMSHNRQGSCRWEDQGSKQVGHREWPATQAARAVLTFASDIKVLATVGPESMNNAFKRDVG